MQAKILVATFPHVDDLLRAVRKARRELFRVYDVFAPFPIHGLDDAMGIRRTKLPYVSLIAALTGLATAVTLQFYTNVLDWPLNVGGKPDNSTLAFVPIAFEMTVLACGLATVAAFLLRSRLFPGAAPALAAPGVTDDRFAIALRWRPNAFDTGSARNLLLQSGAIRIIQTASDL